jgi:hypothetical protein
MVPYKKVIRNAADRRITINRLVAMFENSFPHFHNAACSQAVDGGGKPRAEKVIRKRATISTSYPQ